jgi:hypothetical protein
VVDRLRALCEPRPSAASAAALYPHRLLAGYDASPDGDARIGGVNPILLLAGNTSLGSANALKGSATRWAAPWTSGLTPRASDKRGIVTLDASRHCELSSPRQHNANAVAAPRRNSALTMFFCSGSGGYTLSRAESTAKTSSNLLIIPIPTPDQDGASFGELTDGHVESFNR